MAVPRSLSSLKAAFPCVSQLRSYASLPSSSKLLDSVKLNSGDVIIQNEADSEIGKEVIREAKQRGIKTINLISDKPQTPDLVEELKQLGGDIVITESYANTWYLKRLLSDIPSPSLALNFSEGYLATILAKLLKKGGVLVSHEAKLPKHVDYPGAKRKPLLWHDYLKAKNITHKTI